MIENANSKTVKAPWPKQASILLKTSLLFTFVFFLFLIFFTKIAAPAAAASKEADNTQNNVVGAKNV